MAEKYRNSYRFYSAWNYGKEIEDLNRASDQGWQLVRGGCFHSRFAYNPDIRFRYQLDYRRVEDMGRYIETFREQGWEYVSSTFNGWHYFRKIYDPSAPDEAYEIFTDQESLHEMRNRWARLALVLGLLLGLMAVISAIRFIGHPQLPGLVQTLTFAVESMLLIRGTFLMRSPHGGYSRRGDSALLGIILLMVILGAAGSIILQDRRPDISTEQQADSLPEPLTDNRWLQFEVNYPDWYYLDLEAEAETPVTFAVVNEAGEAVYEETGTELDGKNIRLRLSKGRYWFSMSCESGFHLTCSLE